MEVHIKPSQVGCVFIQPLGFITFNIMAEKRFDGRSEAEFSKNIKESSFKEICIAIRLSIKEHSLTGIWPELLPLGVDYLGGVIQDRSKVTSAPDFQIGSRKVEITNSSVVCSRIFHQKCNKIDRWLKEDIDMVFVNGFSDVNQPLFIRLTPKELEPYLQRSITKYGQTPMPGHLKSGWTSKPARRFDIYWFEGLWQKLPAMIKEIPDSYKELLNNVKNSV